MKKNYTSPVVEVNAFDFEDVVMTSGPYSLNKADDAYETNRQKLIEAAGANVIIVEW